MKRRSYVYGIALLVIIFAGSGSWAYFTADKHTHNIVSTGAIDIEIVQKTEENGLLKNLDSPIETSIMPGGTSSRKIAVKNTGVIQHIILDVARQIIPAQMSGYFSAF